MLFIIVEMAEDEVKLPYNIKENVKNFLLDEVFHSCRTNKHFDFEAGMFMMVVVSWWRTYKRRPQP